MKKFTNRYYGKGLLIAGFLLAAGVFCSCTAGSKEVLSEVQMQVSETTEETAETEKTEAETKQCYVYVCGEVVNPGVYILNEESRIYEAVELAGGFTAEAADTSVNLAETVQDGMKVQIPDRMQAELQASAAGENGNSGKININTADKNTLMKLRGIGETRAEAILQYREEHGSFAAIEDIRQVPGIKNAAFEKIKEDIVV